MKFIICAADWVSRPAAAFSMYCFFPFVRPFHQISAMIHPNTTQATDHAILLTIFTIGCTASSALQSSSSAKRRTRFRFLVGSLTKLGTCSFFSSVRITGSPFRIFTISIIIITPFYFKKLITVDPIYPSPIFSFDCIAPREYLILKSTSNCGWRYPHDVCHFLYCHFRD